MTEIHGSDDRTADAPIPNGSYDNDTPEPER